MFTYLFHRFPLCSILQTAGFTEESRLTSTEGSRTGVGFLEMVGEPVPISYLGSALSYPCSLGRIPGHALNGFPRFGVQDAFLETLTLQCTILG